MQNRKLLFICSLFISFCINSKPFKDSIDVDAVSISISADDNKIIFLENVSLKTGDLVLESDSAIYDELNKTITLEGLPSHIRSLNASKPFNGSASKIIFFNNSKVELIGSAVMNYDNINISSSSIVFNPENGKMSFNK